jgi:EAL domain-containing protein (putative c-di-GMP-specific phosphodiesterase class I)
VPAYPEPAASGFAGYEGPQLFVREAELALRAGSGARLGLVEVEGWQAVKSGLSAADQDQLRAGIVELLAAAGPGVMAGEIAEGRYGLLGGGGLDVGGLAGRLRELVRAGPAAGLAQVSETALTLSPAGLTPAQAARTLRYAITRFAEGGSAAARRDGTATGLAGIIARSEQRARAMREAIAAHRFRLQFQPIVALEGRAVHHYEALLRPTRSDRLPHTTTQDFVLFAEMVGLSEELDLAVLTQTFAALRSAPGVTVAANISGFSMQSPDFRTRVSELLAAHGDITGPAEAPRRLLVELTETAEIENMTAAAGAIAALRAEGVPVCLDDFGAGGAAFRYLREFGVDYVKIDGLYVRAATRGARERGFVASMVELAGAVGARVVAEMVETEEQARLMRELGVQYGQGWVFGRPGSLPGATR